LSGTRSAETENGRVRRSRREIDSRNITSELGGWIRSERVWKVFEDVFESRDFDAGDLDGRKSDSRNFDGRNLDGREFERP